MENVKTDLFFEKYREELLENIMALIRIPSVSSPTKQGPYPFGKDCGAVLDAALALGRNMGFETENHEYYAGSILMPGTGEGEIGIFAHLDVVPEGTGWRRPPYEPYVEEGWLYGRGSTDDKGPAVAALYAMRCILESGVKLRHRVRLFLGCSEENGMHDIAYFLKHVPAPEASFTPDGAFSVCYSEKGILEADFTAPLPEGLISFEAGTASNAVAGEAWALVELPGKAGLDLGSGGEVGSLEVAAAGGVSMGDMSAWPEISFRREGDKLRVEAVGRSAHAAFPDGAVNAGALLAAYLCESGLLDPEAARIISFPAECFKEHFGEKLGISCESEQLGRLTAVCGMIRTEGDRLRLNVNVRYPAECDVGDGAAGEAEAGAGRSAGDGPDEALEEVCNEAAGGGWRPAVSPRSQKVDSSKLTASMAAAAEGFGWKLVSVKDDPPAYVSPDSPLVQALSQACQDRLGPFFVPYTMGGGTYARHLPNAVAYGPGIRGQKKPGPDGHGGGHQPDECIQLKVLEDAFHIYVQALIRLDDMLP